MHTKNPHGRKLMKIKKHIGTFFLTMLNIAIVASVTGFSVNAQFGLAFIPFFILVLVCFFIPSGLVTAELAAAIPEEGGIYRWVRKAFGKRWGFAAACFQMFPNFFWFPGVVAFAAAIFLDIIDPDFTYTKPTITAITVVILWLLTYLNCRGIRTTMLFSVIGAGFGILLPGFFIIILAIYFLASGGQSATPLTLDALIPTKSALHNLSYLSTLFLTFTGIEVAASYANRVQSPQKNFPRSILFSIILIAILYLFASLSIAIIVPKNNLNMITGVIDLMTRVLTPFRLNSLIPIMGILIVLGIISLVNAWIFGPIKSIYISAKEGCLPPYFQKLNKHGMPERLLVLQATVTSLMPLLFYLNPSRVVFFFTMYVMSGVIYMLMYFLLFLTAWRLRKNEPDLKRPFKIPGGRFGIGLTSLLGVCSGIFCLIFAMLPSRTIVSPVIYTVSVVLAYLCIVILPFWIYSKRKPHWTPLE
ncbi:MAG: putative glutamate/gamma-aminobutyrate antiporter [Chlamydiia bacterium]|nr:putative glutamate/gamma-aminobutyrate antiporter [Chlamydiia bacterium]MCH9615763.1 putative glutamate/gamma-aminobutyrate antiporter [Chlamydiia bacterium]MCH9628834.1 putative glutamate/gamma-aminobutyrate antiporter [Chlamydiia bacterium]